MINKKIIASITNEELETLEIINNRISCAAQAACPYSILDTTPKEKTLLFIEAALITKADAQYLEKKWWNEIKQKYNIQKNIEIYLDFTTQELYIKE